MSIRIVRLAAAAALFLLGSLAHAAPPYGPEDLYAAARENNVELRELKSERAGNVISLKTAKAARFPTLDAEVSVTHMFNPLEAITLTAGQFGSVEVAGQGEVLIPMEDMTLYEGMEPWFYQFKLSLEQPIFTWGRIANSVKLYENSVKVSDLQIEAKLDDIRTKCRAYLYSLFYLLRIEDLLAKQQEIGDRLVYITEQGYDNGFVVYADLLETRIRVKEIDLACFKTTQQKRQILLELEHLTGLTGLTVGDLDFTSLHTDPAGGSPRTEEELFRLARLNNKQLKLLVSLKAIAERKLAISKGSTYLKPDLGLRIELSYGGPRLPFIETDWFGQDDYGLNTSLGISTRIFDGGSLRQDVKLKEEEIRAASLQIEEGIHAVEKAISETLLKLSLSRDNLEYYSLRIENQKEQAGLKRAQFETEYGSESDYLTAELSVLGETVKLNQEYITLFTNLLTLEALTGAQ